MERAYSLHEVMSGLKALETRGREMLDPWIIEEIKRKEQRSRIEQPVIQIPAHGPEQHHPPRGSKNDRPEKRDDEEKDPRGVEIIDFAVSDGSYTW